MEQEQRTPMDDRLTGVFKASTDFTLQVAQHLWKRQLIGYGIFLGIIILVIIFD